MKVSHIILKVADLDKAVADFRKKGFVVEYGKEKNPYNALIYFSEGPFLEIMASTGMQGFIKKLLRLFGKAKVAERLDYWDAHKGGYCGLALENYETNLDKETAILKKYGEKWFLMNNRRNDTKGRRLRFKCVFPDNLAIPFFMTYFNVDPKPKDFIHPNGIKGIKSVSFGTAETFIPLIRELCDDSMLRLDVGDGLDVEFEQ